MIIMCHHQSYDFSTFERIILNNMLLTETKRTIYFGVIGRVPLLIYKSVDVFGEDVGAGVCKLEPVKQPKAKLALWDDEEDKHKPLSGKDILNQTFGLFSKITKAIQDNLVDDKAGSRHLQVCRTV